MVMPQQVTLHTTALQEDSGIKHKLGHMCPPRPDALEQTFSGKGPLQASSKIPLRMSDLEHKPTLSTEQRQDLPSESCKDKNQIHQSNWQDTHRSGRYETACPMGEQGLISNS